LLHDRTAMAAAPTKHQDECKIDYLVRSYL
jgi:hypothetical protein